MNAATIMINNKTVGMNCSTEILLNIFLAKRPNAEPKTSSGSKTLSDIAVTNT